MALTKEERERERIALLDLLGNLDAPDYDRAERRSGKKRGTLREFVRSERKRRQASGERQADGLTGDTDLGPVLRRDTDDMRVTPQQQEAAELLMRGLGVQDVADKIGVTRVTVSRWKADPGFAGYLRDLQQQADAGIVARLVGARESVLDRLTALVDEMDAKEAIAALRLLTERVGPNLPKQIEVSGALELSAVSHLSDEELDAEIEALEMEMAETGEFVPALVGGEE